MRKNKISRKMAKMCKKSLPNLVQKGKDLKLSQEAFFFFFFFFLTRSKTHLSFKKINKLATIKKERDVKQNFFFL